MRMEVRFFPEDGDPIANDLYTGKVLVAENVANYSLQTPKELDAERKPTGVEHMQLYATTGNAGGVHWAEETVANGEAKDPDEGWVSGSSRSS